MNKIQQIFHTDKWWGRANFLASFYIVFLGLGYWIWFLISAPYFFNYNIFIADSIFPSVYFLLILPILSFILVFKINKNILKIRKIILIFINLFIILVNLFLFLWYGIYFIKPDMFI